ncbi:MAG TPA: alpha/beta hydrolase [Rhizomicrobium sp.]|nr:alpha/beta hydrolase [Rhizomicrobium sp.]
MRDSSNTNAAGRRSIDLADGAMSCIEWPKPGGPTVLFAHANGFNAETYCALLQPLGDSFHILAFDLRGHGFSTLPATADLATGWTIFRDDLVGAIEQIAGPVILAGHSLGAVASLMAASQFRQRVHALLLIEPVLIPPLREGDTAGAGDLARRAERRRNEFPSFDAAFDAYRGRGIFASWPDKVVADYLRGGLVGRGDGLLRLACAPEWEAAIFRGAPHDMAPLVANIACPITILVGARSSSTSAQQLGVIQRLRPDARVVTVDGASHFLPMEQPEIVRKELLRLAFLPRRAERDGGGGPRA